MTKAKEEKLPAPATETGTAVAEYDWGDDAGAGMENLRPEELKVPMLRILHQMSPQCKPPAKGGIEGAKAGMVFNTVTRDMFDGDAGIEFIPSWRDYNFCEYVPREEGSGFKGTHLPDSSFVEHVKASNESRFGRLATDNGTELVETFYIYGLQVLPNGMIERVVLPFSSTMIKVYRDFINRVRGLRYPSKTGKLVNPPLWAHRWRFKTMFRENDKGSWYVWDPYPFADTLAKSLISPRDELYAQGAEFYRLLTAGEAKADHVSDAKAVGEEEPPF